MGLKTTLADITARLINWDKGLNIYNNGEDNLYQERQLRLITKSVTGLMASRTMQQFIVGKCAGEKDKIIIGNKNSNSIKSIIEDMAKDITNLRGCAVHVKYNALYEIDSFEVRPLKNFRKGWKASSGETPLIYHCEDWANYKKSKITKYNTFNPNKNVVKAQIKAAGSIQKYNGQILYYSMDRDSIYPLARTEAVDLDCDSEHQASVYKNTILRDGWFGKTMIVTRPMEKKNKPLGMTREEEVKYNRMYENERESLQNNFKQFLGAKGSGGLLFCEMDFAGEKLEDAILVKQIESKIDDKIFQFTEDSTKANILMAFNNLPIQLIKTTDTALMGSSAEAFKEMQRMYWKQTLKERESVEEVLNSLIMHLREDVKQKLGGYIELIPLIDIPDEITPEEKNSNVTGNENE